MGRQPFEPANGERARWRILYDLVLTKRIDDQITYREVEDLLECDRQVAHAAMRDARIHLENDGEQSVRTVTNYGWIVMHPRDHLREADRYRRKVGTAAKATVRSIAAIENRREQLSQFERESADRILAAGRALMEITGRRRTPLAELHQRGEQPRQLGA